MFLRPLNSFMLTLVMFACLLATFGGFDTFRAHTGEC